MQILGICGSLRKASFNMAALRACQGMMPQGMTMKIATIGDIPMFNQDLFDAGLPESAKRLRTEVTEADGVLIASPEYNFSLTPALKNAIDWASRPPNQSWQDKPVASHLCHLIVHGVLHLLGFDHLTQAEAVRMESLETSILAELGVPDPYGDTMSLIEPEPVEP